MPALRIQIHIGHRVGDAVQGIWQAVSGSVSGAVVAALLVVIICMGVVHAFVYPSSQRDPVRRFSRQDKAEILQRVGSACEHRAWITGRCGETTNLAADQAILWSRSGPTSIGNGQPLCRRYNRAKRASMPSRWQLRAIARRRAGYSPVGISGEIGVAGLPRSGPGEFGAVVGWRNIVDGPNRLHPGAWCATSRTFRELGRPCA